MKEIVTKVYTFDELTPEAKEKARELAREGVYSYEWWESIYDDANTVGLKLTSFDLDRNRHATGQLLENTEVVAANIIKEHGPKTDTAILAAAFLVDFKKEKDEEAREQLSEEFERALIEEYSVMLQHESEYMVSDQYIDDMIEVNEYTFTETGKRFG